ncbi:hypothetical protein [Mobiluncus porci]|uniref:Uncharacterized protein n=1 Tax=Mobiluncus porci TaxID=2652278 RepID=A0A7K0K1X1_9ACTO|nr:hypothetical protein [Mobiluncus porci]MST49487.1 hypothetical protein [Mobiluncus porci]
MTIGIETPAPVLLQSLTRAGWGELAGNEWQGVRSTLTAIVARSRGKSTLEATVWQIAQSAGLSEKWTARCLYILEGLGVIRWTRGEIVEGKPRPGLIAIMKATLLELIRQAWSQSSTAWARRRAATYARLQRLKNREANIRRSRHAELSADLNGINRRGHQAAAPVIPNDIENAPNFVPRKEETMNQDSMLCDHGFINGAGNCPQCKRITDNRKADGRKRTKEARNAWRNMQARRNLARLDAQAQADRQAGSRQWQQEHPIPQGMSAADWCLVCKAYHPRLTGDARLEHLRQYAPGAYKVALAKMGKKEPKFEAYSPWRKR